jgi:L-2-hydroxyglutarate oxidase LhgO
MPRNPDTRRCTATSKRSGKRCKQAAIKGGTVCSTHGGKAPQVVAVARRRLEVIHAGEQLRQLGIAVETTPIEALEAMLFEAAGNVAVLRQLVGQLPLGEATPANPDHEIAAVAGIYAGTVHESGMPTGRALPHVLVVMYNQERDRLAKLAEATAKLGLDERRQQLAEAQVERLLTAVQGAMGDVGLDTDTVGRFKQAMAARLRGS